MLENMSLEAYRRHFFVSVEMVRSFLPLEGRLMLVTQRLCEVTVNGISLSLSAPQAAAAGDGGRRVT